MSRHTPIRLRDEVLATTHEGMRQRAVAGYVGVTHATINRIPKMHGRLAFSQEAIPQGPHPRNIIARYERAPLGMTKSKIKSYSLKSEH